MSLKVQQAPTFILLKAGDRNPINLDDPIRNNLVDFIRDNTGIKISIDKSSIDLEKIVGQQQDPEMQRGDRNGRQESSSSPQLVFLSMGFVAFALFFMLIYSMIGNWWTKKKLLATIAAITYLACVGGSIFCVLNDSPFWYYHPSGQFKVFYPQYNHQFLFEGLLAGSTMIAFAASLVIMHEIVPSMEEGFKKRLVGIVCIWLFFSSLLTLVMFFTWKNEYYLAESAFGPYLAKLRDLLK